MTPPVKSCLLFFPAITLDVDTSNAILPGAACKRHEQKLLRCKRPQAQMFAPRSLLDDGARVSRRCPAKAHRAWILLAR